MTVYRNFSSQAGLATFTPTPIFPRPIPPSTPDVDEAGAPEGRTER